MDRQISLNHETRREGSHSKWDFWSARESLWSVYESDTQELRRTAVSHLELEPGDTVLDVGCGPGTNFELLREAVGPDGHVLGVDISSGMVDRATERIETHGWDNVDAVRGDATALSVSDGRFDGALATTAVSATPDVRATVENVYATLSADATFAVYDIRLVPSGGGRLLNPVIERFYRAFGNWNRDEDVITELKRSFDNTTVVDEFALGTNYIAIADKLESTR